MRTEKEIKKRIEECKQALSDTAHVSNIYMPEARTRVTAVITALEWVLDAK